MRGKTKNTNYFRDYMRAYRKTEHGKKKKREQVSRWRKRPQGIAYMKTYLEKMKEKRANMTPEEKSALNQRGKISHLKSQYGLTLEEVGAMSDAQGGMCAVCGRRGRGKSGLHIDHDHKTDKVRGLLCLRCNLTLGLVSDSEEVLRGLISYLKKGGAFLAVTGLLLLK
jgi:ATPase subunit of ABC transporter with duplicated ATPase domains